MSATEERDIATRLAPTDFERSLRLARDVSTPWFRCQALAAVSRYAPEEHCAEVADEARIAAESGKDGYQRAAVLAWPIRALSERGNTLLAEQLLTRSLDFASKIEHLVSRLDALELLWQAAWRPAIYGRKRALDDLVAACGSAKSWKAGRCLRDTVLVVAAEDKTKARLIVESMPDGIYRRQTQRQLAAEQQGYLRRFFWATE